MRGTAHRFLGPPRVPGSGLESVPAYRQHVYGQLSPYLGHMSAKTVRRTPKGLATGNDTKRRIVDIVGISPSGKRVAIEVKRGSRSAKPVGSGTAKFRLGIGEGKTLGFVIHSLALEAPSRMAMAKEIKTGIAFHHLENLRASSLLSNEELAEVIAVSPKTISRRSKTGILSPTQSEHLVRFGMLVDQAHGLFEGDEQAARRWLRQPNPVLGGATPLETAETELGAKEVSELIVRLDHGIPS